MVTFLYCMVSFGWDSFPLLPEYDNLSLQMTEAIHRLRCICRDVRDAANLHAAPHVAMRKEVRLAYIVEKLPTFCRDCEIFGAPCVVMPLPTWRVWRVQEWWYVEQCRGW